MDEPASATKARRRFPAAGNRRKTPAAATVGKRRTSAQYTVRDVPAHVDGALRRKAREEGKSLNQVLRDALVREAGAGDLSPVLHNDLDHLAGKWEDDPAFDQAIAAQDRIDESLWR
jgi:hypothetical protein